MLVFLFTVVAMSIAAAGIYTWVDEQGVTHYSQSPPPQGAKSVEMPGPLPEERTRDAQRRLQRLLEGQKRRDDERAAEESGRRARQAVARHRLWGATLTCESARRARVKFGMARPVFRLNRLCERVFVGDDDRERVLELLDGLIPRVCAADYRGDPDPDVESAVRRLQAIDRRYLERRGEPVGYPDFDDPVLTSLADFCRCVPAFLEEMADPCHRTPRSEIEAARIKAANRCPNLR